MPSLISWLDASTEENARMRELVKLFGSPETTDDLGLGQLRDVISNSLFPGTSVLHAGARYMLLVPWSYMAEHRGTKNPEELRKRSEESERRLIGRLKELGVESYIGSDAGRNVKQLPSAAYWSALRRFGIVSPEAERNSVAQLMCTNAPTPEDGEDTTNVWNPSIPPPPEGFPEADERGLTLSHEEASWLRERIMLTCSGSLLAHLVGSDASPDPRYWAPWLDPVCQSVGGEPGQWLRDAEVFSLIHNGATILYLRLLSEHSRAAFSPEEDIVGQTQRLLDSWEDEREAKRGLLHNWDVDDYLARATELNRGINSSTAAFARSAIEAATSQTRMIDNEEFCDRVMTRERLMKKSNSRFHNERRLRAWQPPTSVTPLSFRWLQVRRTVLDVHSGLATENSSNA
ncbi:hypothetical protein ANMWB30_11750 [Arthrobacter sp. MWB30]|nr:hypothetical protein ANMWB30_11750 [Arthrobacter sp. MWB30]